MQPSLQAVALNRTILSSFPGPKTFCIICVVFFAFFPSSHQMSTLTAAVNGIKKWKYSVMYGVRVLRHTTAFFMVLPCYNSTLLITYIRNKPHNVDGICDGTVLRVFRIKTKLRFRRSEALIKAYTRRISPLQIAQPGSGVQSALCSVGTDCVSWM
jgi:hypothetical protein